LIRQWRSRPSAEPNASFLDRALTHDPRGRYSFIAAGQARYQALTAA
jgi:hypothetical protein